jgi:hypothetical protein
LNFKKKFFLVNMTKARSSSSSAAKSHAAPKEATTTSRATRGSTRKRSSDDTGKTHSPEGNGSILSQDTDEGEPENEQEQEILLTGNKKIPDGMTRLEFQQIAAIMKDPRFTFWQWDDMKAKLKREFPNLLLSVIEKHEDVRALLARHAAHTRAWYEHKKGNDKQPKKKQAKQRQERAADKETSEDDSQDWDEQQEQLRLENDEDTDDGVKDDNVSVDTDTGDRVKWPPDNQKVTHEDRWFGIPEGVVETAYGFFSAFRLFIGNLILSQ